MSKETLTIKEIKSQDAFETFLFEAADYIFKRRKLFIVLIIVFLAFLLAVFGGFVWKRHADRIRSEAFYQIEKAIDSSYGNESVLSSIEAFLAKYKNTQQGIIANFYGGRLYLDEKMYDKAEESFQTVVQNLEKTSPLRVLAVISLSNVFQAQGKYQKSIDILENFESSILEETRLFELGEAYIAAGKYKQGESVMKSLLDEYPNSGYKQKAETLLKTMP